MLCFGIFGLNYVLISAGYGIAGVGFATGLMYFIYNAARSFYIYKAYGLNPFRLSHVKLFALAWGLVTLIAFLQWLFPFEPRTTFLTLLRIASVEILILLTFVLPVIYFNLEPEVSGFIRRISADWKKKYFKL
jgi:hypothetical protein